MKKGFFLFHMEISQLHQHFLKSNGVSTDTRKIHKGSIFFALKGDNFNANTFATEALEKGAALVVVDEKEYVSDNRIILVDDVLSVFQELASFHRDYLALPIIALTGSNGKTTTKELINCVLSQKFKTGATVGNLNNHIGVPLTLLSFTAQTQIGIVEMGANHQKEIAQLCQIAKPDFGYITNFGKAHLEGFGGVEGVIKGKGELYDYLKQNDKLAFVNGDDTLQFDKTKDMHRCIFGSDQSSEVVIADISANPFVQLTWNAHELSSNLIGLYNSNNISAAVTIGYFFDVDPHDITMAIASYLPQNNRSQIVQRSGSKIILDAYNANPSSMKVAIENFLGVDEGLPKILVLGDMFELGESSSEEHESIVQKLKDIADIRVFYVGKWFYQHKDLDSKNVFYEAFDKLKDGITPDLFQSKLILIKGSRGMALERLLDII